MLLPIPLRESQGFRRSPYCLLSVIFHKRPNEYKIEEFFIWFDCLDGDGMLLSAEGLSFCLEILLL
ncbi:hypothetical protein MANES_08G100911v8 [Manihot esculenta]|uniref:Uncharacterized protein n=1 Tax=Manihot esculenta TaxID=3983 RepID=A0ACB7HCC3_MANES|nr:hypothetical protein MANES_08G100911v8 [Manihot esculenta]